MSWRIMGMDMDMAEGKKSAGKEEGRGWKYKSI
jgi:hypothetical protein